MDRLVIPVIVLLDYIKTLSLKKLLCTSMDSFVVLVIVLRVSFTLNGGRKKNHPWKPYLLSLALGSGGKRRPNLHQDLP